MLGGLSSEEAQCAAGDEVTLEIEGVVDGRMSGEEALLQSARKCSARRAGVTLAAGMAAEREPLGQNEVTVGLFDSTSA
jgi:hypothetical protein